MPDDFTPIDDFEPLDDFTPLEEAQPLRSNPAYRFEMPKPSAKEQLLRRLAEVYGDVKGGHPLKALLHGAGLTTFPLENLARMTMRDNLYVGPIPAIDPAEQLRRERTRPRITTEEVFASMPEYRPTTGSTAADVVLDIAGAAPLTYAAPVIRGAGMGVRTLRKLLQARRLEKAEEAASALERAVQQYTGQAQPATLPERAATADIPIGELGSRIRGDEAVLQTQAELGPQASLIPRSVLRPTSPEVRGAEQMGVQARVAPGQVVAETPINPVDEITKRIERAETSIEAIETQLENTRKASDVTGIRDTRTINMLTRARDEQKRIVKAGKDELKSMKEAAKVKQAPLVPPPSPEPAGYIRSRVEEAKDWIKLLPTRFRSKDLYLEEKGYKDVVEPIRDAAYEKGKFIDEYLNTFKKLQAEFKLDRKRGEQVARILNGEQVSAEPSLMEAANQIRRQIFDPIHTVVSSDPQLAQLIGPVGYVKEYFPHMATAWMQRLRDPELVQTMIHDLKPANLRSTFWKKRLWDAPEFNMDLEHVINAYVRGSAKTKFDLLAYEHANRATDVMDNVLHKTVASKYLREYMGQPSAYLEGGGELTQPISKMYYRAFIGGNPGTAALNLSQTYLNTATLAGYDNTAKAIKHVMTNWRDAMAEAKASGVLEGYPEINEGLFAKIREDVTRHGFGKVADDFIFSMFKTSEQFNRMVAYFAGKMQHMQKAKLSGPLGDFTYKDGKKVFIGSGKTDEAARRAGWDLSRKSQFLYGKSSPIEYAQSLIGQFSSYPLKQAEFIFNVMTKGDAGQKRRLLAQYGSAAAALSAYDQWKDREEPESAYGRAMDLLGDVVPMPGVGPGVKDFGDLASYVHRLLYGKAKVEDMPEKALKQVGLHTPLLRQYLRQQLKEE